MNVEDAVIAKLNIEGNIFEILVDLEKALDFKKGGDVDISEVIVSEDIFKDVKKGEKASNLNKFFDTEDKLEICKKIIKKGEVQLTAEYKNKLREEKKKQIINLIQRNAVNPENGLPHPITRIENVLNEAKVNVDEFRSAEEQVKEIVDKIRALLPIKYEIRQIEITINNKHAGKCYGILKQFGKVIKDNWLDDGSLNVIIEVPAGLQQDMFDKLNDIAHGEIESKIVRVL
ncbi:MAG: ribosome assembly factor SBDS [Nanoarchaeota archaeon]|nr:ribosome assembly factor SBDS [Nanoarchaeota archaeon]